MEDKKRVYIVVSEYNGYENVQEVFDSVDNANRYISIMKEAWGYENHSFWVETHYIADMDYLAYIEKRYIHE